MQCPKCHAEVPEGSGRCPQCLNLVKPEGFFHRLLRTFSVKSPIQVRVKVTHNTGFNYHDMRSGQDKVYHSMDEVPQELRDKIEQARAAGKVVTRQKFVFRDASGQERTYHSLEEMPLEVRAIFEKARGLK